MRAIENLACVGIKVTLVMTIVNTSNNDGIGQIVEFAAQNIDKVQTIAFQPVSFTGRDEDISDEMRKKWRYTLAGMTHDLKDQLTDAFNRCAIGSRFRRIRRLPA